MPNLTAKSHKSRKTVTVVTTPRQRTQTEAHPVSGTSSSSVESPSSLVPATTASEASANTVPAELPREQQSWFRRPDSKLRKQAEKIAVMRAAGHKGPAIAKRMDTSEGNVRFVEWVARKNGWYDEDDQPVDIEAELAFSVDRKVVRNIDASLDGQMTNWQTHEMTIAAAKGRGIFKAEKDNGQSMQLPIVAIQVVMPPIGAGDQLVIDEGSIGGTPAYIEAEVVNAETQN